MRAYAKQHKIPTAVVVDGRKIEKALAVLGEDVRKHIVDDAANELTSSDLRPFQTQLLTSKAEASIQSLNSFVHSNYAIPTADALRSTWEACVPVFVATYGEP